MDGVVRLAITGAAGWLGRELASYALNRQPRVELLLLGRQPGTVRIAGHDLVVHEWTQGVVEQWQPTHVAHLAFITRDRMFAWPDRVVEELNATLFSRFAEALSVPSVVGALYASSGAAVQPNPDSYGRQKRQEEKRCRGLEDALGVPVGIARVWSVSGRYCTKPHSFLFFDLLRQAIDSDAPAIRIESSSLVWRRYLDACQFLGAALEQVLTDNSCLWNSGGELVSSVSLAERIQNLLAPEKDILLPEHFDRQDCYFSSGNDPNHVFSGTSIRPFTLEEQILHSQEVFDSGLDCHE